MSSESLIKTYIHKKTHADPEICNSIYNYIRDYIQSNNEICLEHLFPSGHALIFSGSIGIPFGFNVSYDSGDAAEYSNIIDFMGTSYTITIGTDFYGIRYCGDEYVNYIFIG